MTGLTELVRVDELAARLGRSPITIRRLAAAGKLPATKIGGTWLINAAELTTKNTPKQETD